MKNIHVVAGMIIGGNLQWRYLHDMYKCKELVECFCINCFSSMFVYHIDMYYLICIGYAGFI